MVITCWGLLANRMLFRTSQDKKPSTRLSAHCRTSPRSTLDGGGGVICRAKVRSMKFVQDYSCQETLINSLKLQVSTKIQRRLFSTQHLPMCFNLSGCTATVFYQQNLLFRIGEHNPNSGPDSRSHSLDSHAISTLSAAVPSSHPVLCLHRP